MTSTLTLATRLATLDDGALHDAIVTRRLGRARIADFFDLAEAMLEPAAIDRALAPLERQTLATLAALADLGAATSAAVVARLAEWGAAPDGRIEDRLGRLLDELLVERAESDEYVAYDAVRERIAAWPEEGHPSAVALAASPPPAGLAAVPDVEYRFVDRLAAEDGFETVGAVTQLIASLEHEPAHELQKGGLGLPDTRRLATALGIEPERVATVLWCAAQAGLLTRDGTSWLAVESDWPELSTKERWTRLASAWLATMSPEVRALLSSRAHARWGDSLAEFVAWQFPAAGPELHDHVTMLADAAERLGIVANAATSSPGARLLESGPREAADAMSVLFPTEVDKVYLQHDLTVVSLGPLDPAVDSRLRRLAEPEGHALASSYRITEASVGRAIAEGETAESLRAFLESVAMSGVPQPLDYLLAEAAARFGRVRVADESGDSGPRSVVRSDDTALIGAIAVDQALSPLALTQASPFRLESRFPRDIVFWALADARYPVAAEDRHGELVAVHRRHGAAPQPVASGPDAAADLVTRLRQSGSADEADTSEAWLVRQLEAAIRSRATLVVTVAMPDEREVEYVLEPSGLGGGRLRGRDRSADIERTVPLSRVRAVRAP